MRHEILQQLLGIRETTLKTGGKLDPKNHFSSRVYSLPEAVKSETDLTTRWAISWGIFLARFRVTRTQTGGVRPENEKQVFRG